MPCPVSNAAPSTYCACWMCSAKFGSQKMGETPKTLSEICGAWWFCWAHITIVLRPNCWGILAITAGSAILTVTDSALRGRAKAILLYYILNIIYYIIYHIIHIILYILYYIYYIYYIKYIILYMLYYIIYIINLKLYYIYIYYIYYMFPVPGPVAPPNGMVPYSVT